jgi:hypothetical protein
MYRPLTVVSKNAVGAAMPFDYDAITGFGVASTGI